MRKNESFEAEAARRAAEAELPQRLAACAVRITRLCERIRTAAATLRARNEPNSGGEQSGTLPQNGYGN